MDLNTQGGESKRDTGETHEGHHTGRKRTKGRKCEGGQDTPRKDYKTKQETTNQKHKPITQEATFKLKP